MLKKKEVYTVVTPIPNFIPRQLAIDILHSHEEVITLNPLVLSYKPIPAPRDAASDEYYSTWYEITERIQFVPGVGKLGSSKISFKGVFHNMPWGLQSHTYVPFGVDIRIRYRISGNIPGVEAPESRELGLEALGAPREGLYLREDIEIRCNISMVSFVKTQLKAASKEMVERIIRKAELLDSGQLHAMMSHDGRLRTVNPNDKSQNPNPGAGMPSPTSTPPGFGGSRPQSYQPVSSPHESHARPATASSHGYPYSPGFAPQDPYRTPMSPPPIPPKEQPTSPQPVEVPGDFQYQQTSSPQPSPALSSNYYAAPHHYPPSDSAAGSADQRHKPHQQHFTAELPANEVRR